MWKDSKRKQACGKDSKCVNLAEINLHEKHHTVCLDKTKKGYE